MNQKERALRDTLSSLGSVVVAYSGGVDSAYLAYVAHRTLGPVLQRFADRVEAFEILVIHQLGEA